MRSIVNVLIVPSSMVSDRLRYTEDVNEIAPAVRTLIRDNVHAGPTGRQHYRVYGVRVHDWRQVA